MRYDVRADLKDALKMLEGLRKDQIPFATAYALTQTAKDAQREVEGEIKRVFDKPTHYTQKAVFVKSATKRDLTATVKLKDESVKGVPAVRYLIYHITGGARDRKGFEKLLIKAGVMPPQSYAIPTRAAKLDAYGNVPRGVINSILSQLQASRDPLSRETAASKKRQLRRKKARPSRYFVSYPGRLRTKHLRPGIYERVTFGFGGAIRPVFLFTDSPPKYRKRLPFYETIDRTVAARLASNFERGFAVAQATQRAV